MLLASLPTPPLAHLTLDLSERVLARTTSDPDWPTLDAALTDNAAQAHVTVNLGGFAPTSDHATKLRGEIQAVLPRTVEALGARLGFGGKALSDEVW